MPTSAASARRALALAVAAGCLLVSACSAPAASPASAPTSPPVAPSVLSPAAAPSPHGPADVARSLDRALRQRATAVRRGDRSAFEAGLGRDPEFVAAQLTYFDNLAQLPLARYSYTFDRGSLVREGAGYWVVVALRLQLEGYDARPVTTPDRFRFEPSRHPGRFVLASVTDPAWEARNHVQAQPWDTGPIEVRSTPGVLGIFDPSSVTQADRLVASVQAGLAAVSAEVPYDWSRSVVIYALSDSRFLDGLDDLPGDHPESLDAVAFPVRVSPDDSGLAATRVVLSPRMLARPGRERDRLVRHELTHVALGAHDDRAPVWLSEGLAEYVSVRPLAPEDRAVPARVLRAARQGVSGLPEDASFNDADADEHYALAWWACEYLSASYGESVLWGLLDAFDNASAGSASAPDQVLRDRLGIGSRALARRAAKLMVATYEPESTDAPGETPTAAPGETPTAAPTDNAQD